MSPYRDERRRMYLNTYNDHVAYIMCLTLVEIAYSCTACAHEFRDKTGLARNIKLSSLRGQKVNNFPSSSESIYRLDGNLIYMFRQFRVREFHLNDEVKRKELHARSAELIAKQV